MKSIFDIFKEVTRFDIQTYFEQYSNFILFDYPKIVDFYERNSIVPNDVISRFYSLLRDTGQINDLFSIHQTTLSKSTSEIWEVLDYFEASKATLWSILNSSRWLRSVKNIFQNIITTYDYNLKQGQSFEMLANELGYVDPDNDWFQIALNNDTKEEDYTFEGGKRLRISFVGAGDRKVMNSIIDSPIGERVYGKDLDRRLTFENNDLKSLSYRDTIIQQTSILVGLLKGSVPEFPADGISKDLVGSNANALQYPMLIRQQAGVFEKDDRYKSISINKIESQSESVIIELQIITRLDEVLNEQLVLQAS